MGIQFFSNWALWEQLTFVLGAGIVVVFFIGWIKLWWMQRLLKKHALLDEEKRARQTELRKSGLPARRRAEIPFGVRAIQSGIEVEGIWISRPVTPMETRSSSKASSTTLDIYSELRPEDKGKAVLGSVVTPSATVTEVEPTPRQSPRPSPTGSYFDRNIRQDIGKAPPPGPQIAYSQPYFSQRSTNDNPNVTRHLRTTPQSEGMAARYHIETYIPTSSSSSASSTLSPRAHPAVDRVSISSEEGLAFSSPRYPADVRGRSSSHYRSPFEDSESPSSAGPSGTQGKYCSRVRAETRGDPFESPETDRTSSVGRQSASRSSLASRPTPVRTYTDQRENISSRVVNAGFEVLPAGTFGRLSGDGRPLNDNSPGLAK